MSELVASPIKKWQSFFEEKPLDALDRLLLGRIYMGALNRNDTNEILYRLFHTQSRAHLNVLDHAVKDWFIKYWGTKPSAVSIQRWNEILRNAFSTVIRLNLSETQKWLFENYQQARVWSYGLYLGPDSDPEADLLRLLALTQRDQSLLPLWMRLCRLEEDRPLHFAAVGLLGLCKLPDESGEPDGDLQPFVFCGIIDLAKAIEKQIRPKKEGEEFWYLKVRALMARYPRSSQYWTERFLPLLVSEPDGLAAKKLSKLIPGLKNKLDPGIAAKTMRRNFLQPPSRMERENILDLLKKRPLEEIKFKLNSFLNEHRNYAKQTGYADSLVKTFSNIGYKILRQDPGWALSLVEEAFSWAPYDAFLWTARAKIESSAGREPRAVSLLWEAKRRFPEEPTIRNILAELLLDQNKTNIAEIIYRQTMADFPTNEVCRNGLAEVLKAQGRLDEAEAIYRQTMKDFPTNAFCRTGLAEVLKAQGGRLEEAEAIYRQAMRDFPTDAVCRTGLAEVLRAQGRLDEAEAIYRQTMKDFPTNAVCRNGLAEVLRAQGGRLDEAEAIYRQTIKDFPTDAVCCNRLAEMLRAQGRLEEAETIYRQTMKDFPTNDEEQEIEKNSMEDILVSDKSSEQVISQFPTNGNGSHETELGLANLYRLASRRTKGTEREQYEIEFKKACDRILAEHPSSVFGLLEKGFWMLEQDSENAKQYFSQCAQNGNKTHVLGFRLGYILAKIQQNEEVTVEEWKELTTEFSNRKLLITYEKVSQELNQSNGKTISILESLRKEMQKDLEALPGTLRKNEVWLRSSISERLFKGIDLDSPISKADLPNIFKNHAQNRPVLQGVIEQSLVNL